MEQIYPLSQEGATPHIGRTICAVCRDGTYFIGKLSGVDESHIYFEGNAQGPGYVSSADAGKARAQIKQHVEKAKVSFFPFFNPFFLPFASLAFLFAFPFFI